MNFAEPSVQSARHQGHSPAEALVSVLVLLHGGAARDYQVVDGLEQWRADHGTPSMSAPEAWTAGLDIEVRTAGPLCRRRGIKVV